MIYAKIGKTVGIFALEFVLQWLVFTRQHKLQQKIGQKWRFHDHLDSIVSLKEKLHEIKTSVKVYFAIEWNVKIMFSALKNKFTNSPSPSGTDKTSDAQANSHHGIGINSMNAALQRKFARGVHYNMKLLLRGDRNTGKSCLFKRLQVLVIQVKT